MSNVNTSSKKVLSEQSKGYSAEYKTIRQEAESSWPSWKKATYNENFAVSVHAKKILSK